MGSEPSPAAPKSSIASPGRRTDGPAWLFALAMLLFLGMFLTKPFHIDDPLFLRLARQIQAHPANPYGGTVNWYGTVSPMWDVLQNPPLAGYYIALAAAALGWTEPALHTAFLLPALAVILGTGTLARRLCRHPLLAAAATLVTPAFLVSSTTLMCDVLMLAFWVWAVVLWIEGIRRANHWWLGAAALLMSLAGLTKYFGLALLPLLAAWSWLDGKPIRSWLAWFLVPLALLAAYQLSSRLLYGRELLSDAGDYALLFRAPSSLAQRVLTTLSFTGGCLAVGVFLAPLLWRPRTLLLGAIGLAALALILGATGFMVNLSAVPEGSARLAIAVQIAVWAGGGGAVLALASADIRARRDADAWLLGLWLGGTFLFAAFCNWTISGRTLLPMAVPFGILIARRLELRFAGDATLRRPAILGPLLAGAVFAGIVARADFQLAQAARQTAQAVVAQYGRGTNNLWFEGHWGFQHYMEAAGASALDPGKSPVMPEDRIVLPRNNSNVRLPGEATTTLENKITVPGPTWLTTMSKTLGAGFYSSVWGPLPFAFGRVPPEGADICRATAAPARPPGAAAPQ